jgi:hypothetical protein
MRFLLRASSIVERMKAVFSWLSPNSPHQTVQRRLTSGVIINIKVFDGRIRSAYLTRDPTVFQYLSISDMHQWINCSPSSGEWKSIVSAAKSRNFENLPYGYEHLEKWDRISYRFDIQLFTISVSDILIISEILEELSINEGKA